MTRIKLSDPEVKAALNWFSRQREGVAFFALLQSVVEEIGPTETCALHAHNARRTFAADLIAMTEAEKSDGPEDGTDERRYGAPGKQRKSRRAGPAGRA